MQIRFLESKDTELKADVTQILKEAFPHAYGDCAEEEVHSCLEEGKVALVAIKEGRAVGFVGAMPKYGQTGWELHPLVVKQDAQTRGIGSLLMQQAEAEVADRGGISLYLGTDDEFGQTSLSGVDLYINLWEQVANIQNPGRHPYEFYQKNGYAVVGVIPDANGPGKPDIIMAKRVRR